MSRTLNLLDQMLLRARTLQAMGRHQRSLGVLRRIARWPNLPAEREVEVQSLLGETYFQLRKYKHARKHFRQVIRLQPDDAEAHLQLARAIDHDPMIDARQASRYYRRALELRPDDPKVLRECGQYAVQMGRCRKGRKLLERALELAPHDFDNVKAYVDGLEEMQLYAEAKQTLRLARFQHQQNSRFHQIWGDLEYRQLRFEQRSAMAERAEPTDTVPFLRLHTAEGTRKPRMVRRDLPSEPGPHFPRVLR
ncbi:MAG TPA: tetratricopeptide repeat protein [Gemmataceae bacterium]|nr:tetratricopeptide repeat protein [Gemmataceae bacterium]